jgi:16S rRNA processing protein RimM
MQDDNWVLVGVIQGAHGLSGQLKVKSLSDNPARFVPDSRLFVRGQRIEDGGKRTEKCDGTQPLALTVVSASPHQGKLLLAFAEITDREAASALLGAELMAEPDAAPLPKGQYYHYQLLGLAVYEQGVYLGRIIEILSRPANDVYIIQAETGGEIWVPALKTVVKDIDLEAKRMEVKLPEGLKGE